VHLLKTVIGVPLEVNALPFSVTLVVTYVYLKDRNTGDHTIFDSFSMNDSTADSVSIAVFPYISCSLRGNLLPRTAFPFTTYSSFQCRDKYL
jgi:hypothetical protein